MRAWFIAVLAIAMIPAVSLAQDGSYAPPSPTGIYRNSDIGDMYFSVLPLDPANEFYVADIVILNTKGCERAHFGMLSAQYEDNYGTKTTKYSKHFMWLGNPNPYYCFIRARFSSDFSSVTIWSNECSRSPYHNECDMTGPFRLTKVVSVR